MTNLVSITSDALEALGFGIDRANDRLAAASVRPIVAATRTP